MTYVTCLETIPFLVINSVRDFRKRQIYVILTVLWGLCGALMLLIDQIITKNLSFLRWSGVLVAIAILLIAKLSKEAIGYGDGLVLLALSFYLTPREFIGATCLAFFLSSIVAVILLVVFRRKKNEQMPFVPFLCLSTMIVFIGEACI